MRGMMVTSLSTVQNLAKLLKKKTYEFCTYKLFQAFCEGNHRWKERRKWQRPGANKLLWTKLKVMET